MVEECGFKVVDEVLIFYRFSQPLNQYIIRYFYIDDNEHLICRCCFTSEIANCVNVQPFVTCIDSQAIKNLMDIIQSKDMAPNKVKCDIDLFPTSIVNLLVLEELEA